MEADFKQVGKISLAKGANKDKDGNPSDNKEKTLIVKSIKFYKYAEDIPEGLFPNS